MASHSAVTTGYEAEEADSASAFFGIGGGETLKVVHQGGHDGLVKVFDVLGNKRISIE